MNPCFVPRVKPCPHVLGCFSGADQHHGHVGWEGRFAYHGTRNLCVSTEILSRVHNGRIKYVDRLRFGKSW